MVIPMERDGGAEESVGGERAAAMGENLRSQSEWFAILGLRGGDPCMNSRFTKGCGFSQPRLTSLKRTIEGEK